MKTDFSLNDLPLYNPWVKKLLGFEEFSSKTKNEKELEREYENEKWGVLLKKLNESNIECSIENVDDVAFDKQNLNFSFYKDQFIECTYGEMYSKYIGIIYDAISQFLPAPALVELGSGYGTILFNLKKKYLEETQLLIGAEFAASGIEIMKKVAVYENFNFRGGHCNFYDLQLDNLRIPSGSIIFTSYATTCVPELATSFLDAIINTKPKIVIHFEPLFEQYGEDLYSLLRKKYIISNDYNRNLLGLVQGHPEIDIEYVTSPQIGFNTLLCPSVLMWRPK